MKNQKEIELQRIMDVLPESQGLHSGLGPEFSPLGF
jgi:hypothetical protein